MSELDIQFREQVNRLVEKNLFDWEISNTIKDPKLLRIFSPLRWNVLDWIPFASNDNVIELGGAFGEFTVRLCDLVSQVFVFEPSFELAEIIKKRCHFATNVSISTETIEDFLGLLPEKIDKIIVHNIRIFRNIDYLINSLRLLFQKYPDSISIIMCDNRKGVQYGNFKIDENNQSLQDFLFSKEDLDGIISSIGYPEQLYFYPYPDSAYAMNIFSDSFLPQTDSITMFELSNIRLNNYIDSQKEFELIQQSIINGNFPDRTNSFLVLAGRSIDSMPQYIKYSNQRADYYCIRTEIYNQSKVRKIPLNKCGRSHIDRTKRYGDFARQQYSNSIFFVSESSINDHILSYPFIKGNYLSGLLDSALQHNEYDFFMLLRKWRDAVLISHNNSFFSKSREFLIYFGDVNIPANFRSGTINNIDLVFDNIIVTDDGKWNVIDNEWSFEFPIPVEYILFRGLFYYLLFRQNVIDKTIQEKCWSCLSIDDEVKSIFMTMETHFQQYCLGRNQKIL